MTVYSLSQILSYITQLTCKGKQEGYKSAGRNSQGKKILCQCHTLAVSMS